MQLECTVSTEPISNALPESLTVLKSALRIEHSADDDYLKELMRSAASQITDRTGRQLLTATRRLSISEWWTGSLDIPFPKLQTVNSIEYIDENGDTQTLDAGLYRVFTSGTYGRVVLDSNVGISVDPDVALPITIYFDCGYGADTSGSSVPAGLRVAVRELVRVWYEEQDLNQFTIAREFPQHVDALLDTWKLKHFWTESL